MNIIYIARIDEEYSLDLGVAKKINGQINAFKDLKCNVDYLRIKNKKIVLNNVILDKIKYRKFAYRNFYNCLKRLDKRFDFAYLRYTKADMFFFRTVKLLYKKGIKVIIEIPTYPYLVEVNNKSVLGKLEIALDNIITGKLKRYVHRICTTSKENYIFGIETIKINNGININSIPVKKKSCHDKSIINMIGIGNLARWHGYDRIIKGLANYYKENNSINIQFFIVGEGRERVNLESLTAELNIKNYVHFLGSKTGKELDDIFDEMDLGISSLALFRAGGGHDPIKSKEFLGRGLPILLAYDDKLIDMSLEYVFLAEESESAIDISEVVERYKCINSSSIDIRNYAYEHLSWNKQMIKVINEL